MFVDLEGQWGPPPREPPPRKVRISRKPEWMLLCIVNVVVLALLILPFVGPMIMQTVAAVEGTNAR